MVFNAPPLQPPRRRSSSKRRPTPPPSALSLIAATYDNDAVTLTLTFDRAIDVAGINGAEITVNDADITGNLYDAAGGAATLLSPTTVRLELTGIDSASGTGVTLNASASAGIVAVDDGAVWVGVADLELPFP